jgi:nicotinate phosphoribosyltransferase
VFGGVYKLVAIEEDDGTVTPKIKISENPQKITTPHFKKLYRLYNNDNGKAEADIISVYDEEIDDSKPIEIFDPHYTWKRKVLENVTAVPLQARIFDKGRQVYSVPDIDESRRLCAAQLESMWKEVLRWENPHNYYVDLTESLWNIKDTLLRKLRNKQ